MAPGVSEVVVDIDRERGERGEREEREPEGIGEVGVDEERSLEVLSFDFREEEGEEEEEAPRNAERTRVRAELNMISISLK